ncbi:hypothetical protein M5D96_008482, partial [Drosophila gunungcola]
MGELRLMRFARGPAAGQESKMEKSTEERQWNGKESSGKLGVCRSMAHKMSAIIVNSTIIEQVKSVASSKEKPEKGRKCGWARKK